MVDLLTDLVLRSGRTEESEEEEESPRAGFVVGGRAERVERLGGEGMVSVIRLVIGEVCDGSKVVTDKSKTQQKLVSCEVWCVTARVCWIGSLKQPLTFCKKPEARGGSVQRRA